MSSVVFSLIGETVNLKKNSDLSKHDRCPMFSGLFRGSLCETFAQSHRPQHFKRGEFIYQSQDAARSIFLLRRGLIKTAVSSRTGRELILSVYTPGDLFGELCFCHGKRLEYAIAMEESECVEIAFDDLVTHLQKNQQKLVDFLSTVCDRLSSAYVALSSLAFERTEQRLARLLLKLAEEVGEPSPHGRNVGHYIKQEELAAMIGAPREMVSSLLQQFRQKHLISYSRRGHLTVDMSALRDHLLL